VALAFTRNFVEKEGFFSRRVRHIHTHPTAFPASATLSAFRPTTTARGAGEGVGGENIPAEKKITQCWQNGCRLHLFLRFPFCLFHILEKVLFGFWISK